jgi:hypothetical protein
MLFIQYIRVNIIQIVFMGNRTSSINLLRHLGQYVQTMSAVKDAGFLVLNPDKNRQGAVCCIHIQYSQIPSLGPSL